MEVMEGEAGPGNTLRDPVERGIAGKRENWR